MKAFQCHWFFLGMAILCLFANFYGHIFSTLPLKRFLNNEFPSERFVIARMIYNESHQDLQRAGGFMVSHPDVELAFMAIDQGPYEDLRQNVLATPEGFSPYYSHLGFQDNVLAPLWRALIEIRGRVLETTAPEKRWHERLSHFDSYYFVQISQGVVALGGALILGLFLLWVAREFSISTAWVTLGLMLVLMPDLTFFGRSMWWMMGTWFLPFLIGLYAYSFSKGQPLKIPALILVSVLTGLALSLKTSMGYEFTSTIMVSALIPLTYYGFKNRWSWKSLIGQSFVIGIFQLAGLALTLYLHYHALADLGLDPVETIRGRFEMRAHGAEIASHSGAIQRSVEASAIGVIAQHLFSPQDMGVPQFIIMLPLLGWLWKNRNGLKTSEYRPMLLCIALGFFGAISMFVILKGHAYIHGFDVVAWSIPMNLFLCVFYARALLKRV